MGEYTITGLIMTVTALAGGAALTWAGVEWIEVTSPRSTPADLIHVVYITMGGTSLLLAGLIGRAIAGIARSTDAIAAALCCTTPPPLAQMQANAVPVSSSPPAAPQRESKKPTAYRGHAIEHWPNGFFAAGKLYPDLEIAHQAIDEVIGQPPAPKPDSQVSNPDQEGRRPDAQ